MSDLQLFGAISIRILVIGIIYFLQGLVLYRLHKLIYGFGNIMAWIPLADIYLLGKVTIDSTIGWALLLTSFLLPFLPYNIEKTASNIYSIAIIILYIFAIFKYFKLRKLEKNTIIRN